jgi:hypothetical protein
VALKRQPRRWAFSLSQEVVNLKAGARKPSTAFPAPSAQIGRQVCRWAAKPSVVAERRGSAENRLRRERAVDKVRTSRINLTKPTQTVGSGRCRSGGIGAITPQTTRSQGEEIMAYSISRFPRELARFLIVVVAALIAGLPVAALADSNGPINITVLSSRPDTVSGSTALVRISVPNGVPFNNLMVLLNSRNVTSAFRPEASGRSLLGLIEEMPLGRNELMAGAIGPNNRLVLSARLTLTNYPITGPIFSGPHEQPFYCMTQLFKLPASTQTLGPALDADCSTATRVDYVYRTTAGAFAPLPSLTSYPADLAQTTTSEGKTVPYIVRVETGTINRGIYETAVLHDPTREKPPTPFNPPAAWNHRLIYTLGGGCVGGWYIQGSSIGNGGILEDLHLRQGYGIAASSLNVFGNQCGDLVAAETVTMVRARFIENFGPVEFTIGYGCSGGTEAGHPIADEYPGLLDGLVMGCSFPEVTAAMINNVTDADLFLNYLNHRTSLTWSDAQIEAATGYPTVTTLTTIGPGSAIRTKAQAGTCNMIIHKSVQYDAKTNPTGIRCDIYDHMVNVFGRDSKTGFARRPLDNVGVQYGLDALNMGAITKQQFLDLNQNIGGYDNDGNYVAIRSVGDIVAIDAAYDSGRITYGGLGLRHTPIIDYRGYVDQPENGNEVHSRFHSFSMRQRLVDANGNFDNQVMLVENGFPPPVGNGLFSDTSPVLSHALTQMDEWLTNLLADSSNAAIARKISRAKPGDLVDACFTNQGTVKIAQQQVYTGATTCNQLYPAFSTPRMVAGEPLENDVLKCRLKLIDLREYKVAFTTTEAAQLKKIFPQGVCDYALPGVDQSPTDGTWQFF